MCWQAGDAATAVLLPMLSETDHSLVVRAATALGESVQHPTVEVIRVIGDTITRASPSLLAGCVQRYLLCPTRQLSHPCSLQRSYWSELGADVAGLRGLTRMAEGFTLEYVKAERQLATFADQDYQRMYREQHHCHAIDVLAQALCKSPWSHKI